MILALIILFLSALFLVWQGTLPLQTGFVLMAVSISAITWKHIRKLQTRRRIRLEIKERKAKWGGILTVVSGLSSFVGMPCQLFITRRDELIVEDIAGIRVIPLSEIQRMALFYGKTLDRASDQQLMRSLGFQTLPRFSNVRAWIQRNPKARSRQLLAVRFEKPLNELEYSEMVVFSAIEISGNLRAFAMRPEVAIKTSVLTKRAKTENKGKK